MFDLMDSERRCLDEVRAAVREGRSAAAAMEACRDAAAHVRDRGFPFTYAAILFASRGDIETALDLLRRNRGDTFSDVLRDYLAATGAFAPVAVVFESASPYNVWVRTRFYREHEARVLEAMRRFAVETPPPPAGATIFDIGTGNGVLLSKIVRAVAPVHRLERVRLILLDPFPDMLRASRAQCEGAGGLEVDVTCLCCRIEEMTGEQRRAVEDMKPLWFANAALSVHHMPREVKIPMLRAVRDLTPHCLITEVNWNHDRPEKGSPELVYSVVKAYGYILEDLLASEVTEAERRECIHGFWMAEAIRILDEDRPRRVDYHAPVAQWRTIAEEAGFAVVNVSPTVTVGGEPFAFVMELGAGR